MKYFKDICMEFFKDTAKVFTKLFPKIDQMFKGGTDSRLI
jgi:hypothetical protein